MYRSNSSLLFLIAHRAFFRSFTFDPLKQLFKKNSTSAVIADTYIFWATEPLATCATNIKDIISKLVWLSNHKKNEERALLVN